MKYIKFINQEKVIETIHRRTGIPEIDIQLTIEKLREIVIETTKNRQAIYLSNFLWVRPLVKKADQVFSNIHTGQKVPIRYRVKPGVRFSTKLMDELNDLEPRYKFYNDKKEAIKKGLYKPKGKK